MDIIPGSPSPKVTNFSDLKVDLFAKDPSAVTQSSVIHSHVLVKAVKQGTFFFFCKSLFIYLVIAIF